ncbi:chemotaxis protein CheY [Chitinispirillum alkaliphilum]|nr:chemotaxis protein CheY [Chitinispirillum alkaliphilum]
MIKLMSSLKKKNKRILIVDDEADVLDFLKLYLESLGWEIITVTSTEKAFEELEKQPFFLILTDIAMPEMDGYEFISKIKEKQIPSQMALMTGFGYNPKHTLVKIYKTIRYPCLFKPFNRAKVAETVQNAWDTYHQDILQSESQN